MSQQIIIPASDTKTILDILNGTTPIMPSVTFSASVIDVVLEAVLTAIPTTTTTTTPAPQTTFTIFGNVNPGLTKRNDGEPLELGLKFKSSQAGVIKGIRFYKAIGTIGAHTGNLWSSAGVKMGSASFSAESASGWQEVYFITPIAIAASTTYTASVYFASGDYIIRASGLGSIISNGPLSTISGTNGVYKYGTSGFPSASYQNSNYFIDVIFSTDVPPPVPTTTSTTTSTTTEIPTPPSTGIQGFGADVTGGGSGQTIHITSLSQFAGAIDSNRNIIFDVSGTIIGRFDISNVSNLTIDAYSSKQDVTIDNGNNGDGMNLDGCSNVIIRGLRFINAGNDGLNVTGSSNNVVFDHCSAYNNRDGSIDIAATANNGKNFTVQYCFMGKNLGSGNMLITAQNASVHHNLFVGDGTAPDGQERNPYAHSNYSPVGTPPNFDFRNNLIHASGRYASGNGYKAVGNYVNNYYTSNKAGLINLCADSASCGTAYVSGNFNQPSSTGGTTVSTPYSIPAKYQIAMTDPKTAARDILTNVGPWKRSSYEQGVIDSITISA